MEFLTFCYVLYSNGKPDDFTKVKKISLNEPANMLITFIVYI